MQETILLLRQQLNSLSEKSSSKQRIAESESTTHRKSKEGRNEIWSFEEIYADENTPKSVMSLNQIFSQDDPKERNGTSLLNSQVLIQVSLSFNFLALCF
jgi:centromeric protein E